MVPLSKLINIERDYDLLEKENRELKERNDYLEKEFRVAAEYLTDKILNHYNPKFTLYTDVFNKRELVKVEPFTAGVEEYELGALPSSSYLLGRVAELMSKKK